MIAGLYNIPTDIQAMQRFSFYNNDAHVDAVAAIRRLTNVSLPVYPIDPIPVSDFQGWLYTHQSMHNSVNSALSLAGNDLTSMDPSQIDQLTYWIEIHANEHVQWADKLGLG